MFQFCTNEINRDRISSLSTLTDNMFCNLTFTTKSISANLISTVSIHLLQFLILPEFFSNAQPSIYNTYTNGWEKIDEEKFIFEFNSQDWVNIIVLDKKNVNETIDNYLQNLNNSSEKHAPLTKLYLSKRKSFNKNLGSQKDYKSQLRKKLNI